jgi:hypothetical protein
MIRAEFNCSNRSCLSGSLPLQWPPLLSLHPCLIMCSYCFRENKSVKVAKTLYRGSGSYHNQTSLYGRVAFYVSLRVAATYAELERQGLNYRPQLPDTSPRYLLWKSPQPLTGQSLATHPCPRLS